MHNCAVLASSASSARRAATQRPNCSSSWFGFGLGFGFGFGLGFGLGLGLGLGFGFGSQADDRARAHALGGGARSAQQARPTLGVAFLLWPRARLGPRARVGSDGWDQGPGAQGPGARLGPGARGEAAGRRGEGSGLEAVVHLEAQLFEG